MSLDEVFVTAYFVLLGAAVVNLVRVAWAGVAPSVDAADLDPYEVAVLNNARAHAVLLALWSLREAGSVRIGDPAGTVAPVGPLPPYPHPVERTVYHLLGPGEPRPVRTLRAEAAQASVFAELRDRLGRLGQVRSRASVRRVKRHALWLVPVLALGVGWLTVRWADLIDPDAPEPYGILPVCISVVALAATLLVVLCIRSGRANGPVHPTLRGHNTLRSLNSRHQQPGPVRPGALPWALALSGPVALWDVDPSVAAALELPREAAMRRLRRLSDTYLDKFGGCGGGCGG